MKSRLKCERLSRHDLAVRNSSSGSVCCNWLGCQPVYELSKAYIETELRGSSILCNFRGFCHEEMIREGATKWWLCS